ncbi:Bacterial regulatory proteins, luxR family [Sodalis glossinidius str. 'morsitans']|nr:helix-turn-helix transcriptional regulator [Sodalis glossinidius]CRL45539.1 Bacterial regulatory proteins, luxR family [Sodalis glossinidius str. 'morsitans']
MDVDISPQLIYMFENSKDPWGVKLFTHDKSFHYYSNQSNLDMLNLPVNFDIEGKTDIEIPHPTSEYAYHFQNHDFEILKRQINITSIDIYPYGKEATLQPYACEKFPLYDCNKCCIGVVYHARKFSPYNLGNLLNINVSGTYTCRLGTGEGGALDPDDMFTEREMEIIFLTIHALSAKEAARVLNISHRTVENRLRIIYQKIGINSSSQLAEFCRQTKLHYNIPPGLLKMGSYLHFQ